MSCYLFLKIIISVLSLLRDNLLLEPINTDFLNHDAQIS